MPQGQPDPVKQPELSVLIDDANYYHTLLRIHSCIDMSLYLSDLIAPLPYNLTVTELLHLVLLFFFSLFPK